MDKFDADTREYVVRSDHSTRVTAASHFIARGRRAPAFFGAQNRPFVERLAGFRKALADAKVEGDERLQLLVGPDVSRASAITAWCARVPMRSTCREQLSGDGVPSSAHLRHATEVPQDLSLIGGENEEFRRSRARPHDDRRAAQGMPSRRGDDRAPDSAYARHRGSSPCRYA